MIPSEIAEQIRAQIRTAMQNAYAFGKYPKSEVSKALAVRSLNHACLAIESLLRSTETREHHEAEAKAQAALTAAYKDADQQPEHLREGWRAGILAAGKLLYIYPEVITGTWWSGDANWASKLAPSVDFHRHREKRETPPEPKP